MIYSLEVRRNSAGVIASQVNVLPCYRSQRLYSSDDLVGDIARDIRQPEIAVHETLSGPATQKILHREFHEFHDARYQRLARLSAAQMYRFRKSLTYRERYITYQPTKPAQVAIGERRKPDPQGRPGYLRVDTVHQGDLDGIKGLYHIDAVDEVTQWQVVGATEQSPKPG